MLMNSLLNAPILMNGKAHKNGRLHHVEPTTPESLRERAWRIGEHRAAHSFLPTENHVGLAQVTPYQAFAHWRIRQEWIDESSRRRGPSWSDCRLILRLYD